MRCIKYTVVFALTVLVSACGMKHESESLTLLMPSDEFSLSKSVFFSQLEVENGCSC